MDTNTTQTLATIYRAAERAGILHVVSPELWNLRSMTPAAQHAAIPRWHAAMRTWPTPR